MTKMNRANRSNHIIAICMFGGILAACIWMVYCKYNPIYPSGHVIDSKFMSTLKFLHCLKLGISALFILVAFVPPFVMHDSPLSPQRKLRLGVGFLVIILLGGVLGFRSGELNVFAKTYVSEKTVEDKKIKTTRKTSSRVIYFTDDTSAQVTSKEYKQAEKGDTYYVVFNGKFAIGIFPTESYTVEEN